MSEDKKIEIEVPVGYKLVQDVRLPFFIEISKLL
jgi:hypothetical protein